MPRVVSQSPRPHPSPVHRLLQCPHSPAAGSPSPRWQSEGEQRKQQHRLTAQPQKTPSVTSAKSSSNVEGTARDVNASRRDSRGYAGHWSSLQPETPRPGAAPADENQGCGKGVGVGGTGKMPVQGYPISGGIHRRTCGSALVSLQRMHGPNPHCALN